MNQTTKDILSGFFSGWCQVLIMQPFEIVKVRLQTQCGSKPYYKGIGDAFKKIGREEGIMSFYKGKSYSNTGTVTPLIGIGFQASAMFFSYESAKRFFGRFKENSTDRLSLKYIALSGLFASLPTSLIAVLKFLFRPQSNTQGFESKSKKQTI